MEDEREEELSSISAIFPELVINPKIPFSATLDLPIALPAPASVRFPAAPLPTFPASHDIETEDENGLQPFLDEHRLSYLPALHLDITLPSRYPADQPPELRLSTTPAWIPEKRLRELEEQGAKLWEEYGHCQILYIYIDTLQQDAERVFDLPSPLELLPTLKFDLLHFDSTTIREVFETGTYDCGICLEPKKGSSCYRLERCSHVFCLACLQDFYNSAITEGDVVSIKCLDPDCGKSKGSVLQTGTRKRKREHTLHPRELLEIGISEPNVRRYVDMKRKKLLEADKSTIYCPRSWCQAPARSDKYPPIPTNLLEYPESDDDTTDDRLDPPPAYTKDTPENRLPPIGDRLAICSKCTLAFCRVCYTGWHGEFARCWPRNPADLSDEEKASYDYIRMHTSPCPTCSSPTQKTMGCNHMKCFQCNSHFCYLCSSWLDPQNPYQHFNKPGHECYQRLWELEEGDEGAGRVQFEGARRYEAEANAEAMRQAEEMDHEEALRLQGEEDEAGNNGAGIDEQDPDDDGDEEGDFVLFPRGDRRANPPDAPARPADRPVLPNEILDAMARLGIDAQQGGAGPPRAAGGRRGQRGRPQRGGREPHQPQRPQQQPVPRVDVDGEQARLEAAQAAAAIRRFMELAQRDEEDGWDSDELEDDEMWEIRAR